MSTCKYCGQSLEQKPGGRKREYCDDACRQAAHRTHAQEVARERAEQEVASWGEFLPATIKHLAGYIVYGSRDTARKQAGLIQAEQEAHRRKKPMGKADLAELEQARADLLQLRKLNNVWSEEIHQWVERCKDLKMDLHAAQEKMKRLESQGVRTAQNKQEISADQVRQLYQVSISAAESEKAAALSRVKDLERQVEQLRTLIAKQENALAVQSETVIKRGATLRKQEKAIAQMESDLERARRGSEQVQEQCRQTVSTLNLKIGHLAGENHTVARDNLNLARQVAELSAQLAESGSEQVEALTIRIVELEQENTRLKQAQT